MSYGNIYMYVAYSKSRGFLTGLYYQWKKTMNKTYNQCWDLEYCILPDHCDRLSKHSWDVIHNSHAAMIWACVYNENHIMPEKMKASQPKNIYLKSNAL